MFTNRAAQSAAFFLTIANLKFQMNLTNSMKKTKS